MASGRTYIIPEMADAWPASAILKACEAPSVTTVLRVLAKETLVPWAAKLERAHALDTVRTLLADPPAELASALTSPDMTWPEAAVAVTEALGTALGKYAYMRESRRAMNYGTRIHEAIEARLTGQPEPELSDAQRDSVEQWQRWADNAGFTVLATELKVWHREHRYAGRLDMLARVGDLTCVVDWKTSKAIWSDQFVQLAAYARAVEHLDGIADVCGLIVRVPKVEGDTIEPRFLLAGDIEEHWQTFVALRHVWDWSKRND